MNQAYAGLSRAEALPLELRRIYEKLGYKKYVMGKFEPYDVYLQNPSYLKNEGIITFTDPRGRLMALKPDVTMSIVKNTAPGAQVKKLFYCENVFRADSSSRECKEISQMGLEYIGGEGIYAESEVVRLALESLRAISEEFVLDLSHIGFVDGLLSALGLTQPQRAAAVAALEQKSAHGLAIVAAQAGLGESETGRLCALRELAGEFGPVLGRARELAQADAQMTAALDELAQLYGVLRAVGRTERIRLDFSVMNDIDYYNGLIFRGYVCGAPRAVLAGGRYDNLMRRFDKPQAALGFAVYLGELDRYLREEARWDVEALLVYGDAEPALTARAVEAFGDGCGEVMAVKFPPQGLRARRLFVLAPDGRVMEVNDGASCCAAQGPAGE